MNFPAIAKNTFDRFKENPKFILITDLVIFELKAIKNAMMRARHIHKKIDEYNKEVMSHPLVEQLKGCKKGCSGCCHTEVSVTDDEGELLAQMVKNGIKIDTFRHQVQHQTMKEGKDFYTIPYDLRACVFLNEEGLCKVYNERPAVCRTNAVLGDSEQCSTKDGKIRTQNLVKTEKADMVIMGAYLTSPKSGSLTQVLWDKLNAPKPIAIKKNMHPVVDYKAYQDNET